MKAVAAYNPTDTIEFNDKETDKKWNAIAENIMSERIAENPKTQNKENIENKSGKRKTIEEPRRRNIETGFFESVPGPDPTAQNKENIENKSGKRKTIEEPRRRNIETG